jgi:hypothetical protein
MGKLGVESTNAEKCNLIFILPNRFVLVVTNSGDEIWLPFAVRFLIAIRGIQTNQALLEQRDS